MTQKNDIFLLRPRCPPRHTLAIRQPGQLLGVLHRLFHCPLDGPQCLRRGGAPAGRVEGGGRLQRVGHRAGRRIHGRFSEDRGRGVPHQGGGTPFGESILKFKTSKTFLVLRAASRRNPPPQGGTHSRPPSSLAGAQRIRPPCLLLGGPTFKQSLVVSATLWNSPGVRPGAGPLREGPQAP